MRLAAITVFKVSLPLAQSFQHASSGLIQRLDEVVVKIDTEDGVTGYGEVRGNAPYVTGDSQAKIIDALRDLLIPPLLAEGETSRSEAGFFMDRLVPGNAPAKAVLDIALHDCAAKAVGIPVRALLGGHRDSVKIHGTIPFCPPEEAARRACTELDLGVTAIKVRVGLRPFSADLARVQAVHQAIRAHPAAETAKLAVDTNQGWAVKEAIRALKQLEPFELAWAEQPVRADDVRGLKEVRNAVDVPIVADEACGSPQDLLRLIELRAVDAVHLKLLKAGGIRKLMGMVAMAEAAGLGYIMGQMDEGMLATAAGLHCAAASAPFSCELWGYQRVASQPFSGLEMEGGAIAVKGPGLGVAVDEGGLTEVSRFEVGRR